MKLGVVVSSIESVKKGETEFLRVNFFSKELMEFLNGYVIFKDKTNKEFFDQINKGDMLIGYQFAEPAKDKNGNEILKKNGKPFYNFTFRPIEHFPKGCGKKAESLNIEDNSDDLNPHINGANIQI